MRLVIDDFKSEHYKLLAEMAKTLNFKVSEIELSEEEEDRALLMAMESTKNEPNLTKDEANEFENWLNSIK